MNDKRKQFNRRFSDTFFYLLPRVQQRLGTGSDQATLEVLLKEKARELGIEWTEPERFPVRENDEAPQDHSGEEQSCGAV